MNSYATHSLPSAPLGRLLDEYVERTGRTNADIAATVEMNRDTIGKYRHGRLSSLPWWTADLVITRLGYRWHEVYCEERGCDEATVERAAALLAGEGVAA